MVTPDEKLPRDRGRTEANILAAAKHVLAESGFQGFGINAVARRAGCDKQLIYRYFGGIDGLVDAIGDDIATWLSVGLANVHRTPASAYGELMEQLLMGFLTALRGDMLVQKIAAWEIADPSELVARLSQARGKALAAWIASARGDLAPPPGIDAPAMNAILIAAVQHLVLSATTTGHFAGVALTTGDDWERITTAIRALVRAVYATAQDTAQDAGDR